VIDHYTTDKLGEKEISSDKEKVKEINIAKALKYVGKLKLWKLQKRNDQDL
jgi:hypothetical protein